MGSETFEGYDRVSDVIGWFSKFRKCDECGRTTSGINEVVLENKCRIGSEVHEAIELFLKNIEYPVNSECKGYLESFKAWDGRHCLDVFDQERRIFNKDLMLTGQIDLICRSGALKEKGKIYDWKTSASPDPSSWQLQGAFYYILLREEGIEPVDTVSFLWLQKNGSAAREYVFDVDNELIDLAMNHLKIYRKWRKKC